MLLNDLDISCMKYGAADLSRNSILFLFIPLIPLCAGGVQIFTLKSSSIWRLLHKMDTNIGILSASIPSFILKHAVEVECML